MNDSVGLFLPSEREERPLVSGEESVAGAEIYQFVLMLYTD